MIVSVSLSLSAARAIGIGISISQLFVCSPTDERSSESRVAKPCNCISLLIERHRIRTSVANKHREIQTCSLFGWLVADGWCWFVLREEYCWRVAGGWFVLRGKYYWLVADKPREQAVGLKFAPRTEY
jgi:hypothetical protein